MNRTLDRTRQLLVAAAGMLLASGATAFAADAPLTPAAKRLKADVSFFAADDQEGRAPGTKGIEKAADRIAATFKELGLKPAPGAEGYFQKFSLRGAARLDGPAQFSLKLKGETKDLKAATEFNPLALGRGLKAENLPVAFVGYGISAKNDDKVKYDDYEGIDVKGKAVILMRLEPQVEDEKSVFDGKETSRFADLRVKTITAFQKGAAAVVLVNNSTNAKTSDRLLAFNYTGGEQAAAIPVLMTTRATVDAMLAAAGKPTLSEIEKGIDADLKPRSAVLESVSISGEYKIDRPGVETKNVVGVLEGKGPLADETIVIGAHYDHLGRGGLTSGSLAFLSNDVHNGADDNASGTSLVLELARRLAKRPEPLPRRIVFMLFSAEEKGLIGSMHYVNNPLIPLKDTVMMINFDMVGRLNDKDELSIFGVGSTPGADALVDALGASAGFKIKKVYGMSDGIGGSDHQSFYMKNIPVIFAFTGLHNDYHRPSDDADKINYAGMARIADFGELIALDSARRPKRPEFTKAEGKTASAHGSPTSSPAGSPAGGPRKLSNAPASDADPGRMTVRAYFGSIPDYSEGDEGVKLSGVSEGGPAEKAGLKSGDVIVGFGGKPVSTITDYTAAMAQHKAGDKVDVKFKRDGKEMTVGVTLTTRPGAPK